MATPSSSRYAASLPPLQPWLQNPVVMDMGAVAFTVGAGAATLQVQLAKVSGLA